MKVISLIFSALFVFNIAFAQECYPIDKDQIKSIQKDIENLSSDRMEGRAPGTPGGNMARDYISRRFSELNIVPMGENEYYQVFDVPEPVKVDEQSTYAVFNNDTLTYGEQYYASPYSNNSAISSKAVWVNYGITSPEKEYDDYKKVKSLEGKIAVMDVSSPDGIHPHSEYAKYHDVATRIAKAKEKGAVGVVLVNLGEMAEDPRDVYKKTRNSELPVIFLKDDEIAKKVKKGKPISFSVSQEEQNVEAFNIVGFIDNGMPTTVVIGAHYDHLGYGGKGTGSLYRGEPAIHNGADDNASGTAALIALAESLNKKEDLTGHNYLFIAFTAEERGLLGSNYFVNNPTYPIENMAYMINMDMVGRLREGKLQIGGTGTARQWDEAIERAECPSLNYSLDPSGVGPSDHTSFYNVDVPVLFFFTGTHEDYHKPADDADKINYKGIAEIISVAKTIMKNVDDLQHLDFQQTKNENAKKAPRFSVTLGIMPDYMYNEVGVRVDGVTEGRPAQIAGLQKGDIIMQLGDFKVTDMYAYMNALASFKKGDKAKVVYMRGEDEIEGEVQF